MSNQDEIKNSIIKSLFSLVNIPIIGPALTEMLDFRGKLKQNRLNQFTELLENYFSNHSGINLENFQTVEFSDLFESVLKRVIMVNSVEKMRMFKDILIKQLENPSQSINESEIYLDLVSELTEIEIKILFEFRQLVIKFQPQAMELLSLRQKLYLLECRLDKTQASYNSELLYIQNEIKKRRREMNRLQNLLTHNNFKINIDEFLFYKQRLFSKALLVDNGIGSIEGVPFETMWITQFGIQFIDYVVSSK